MFAEERLKERMEKVRLDPTYISPYINHLPHSIPLQRLRSVSEVVRLPPVPTHPSVATIRGHTHLTWKPHPQWIPQAIPPLPLRQSPYKLLRQQHYQQIKELVEQKQHLHTSHISHSPHLHTSHISHSPHLPSHLISYISEVWNK